MKTTQFEKLQNLAKAAKRGDIKNALEALVSYGKAHTGYSGYKSGRAHKKVWTDEVCELLEANHIAHESGNDAPRGGANGEYVQLKGQVLRDVKGAIVAKEKEAQRQREIDEQNEAQQLKEKHERAVVTYAALKALNPDMLISADTAKERSKMYYEASKKLGLPNNAGFRAYFYDKNREKNGKTDDFSFFYSK